MVCFPSIRRGSEQWAVLLLPDFVAIGHFHLNLFFPTWEDLDIHILSCENQLKIQFSSEHTAVLWQHFWNEVLYYVVLYVILYIHLQASPLKKISKCWLTLKTMWADRKKCKNSLSTRMCFYEREDQCAMFKAKQFWSMPMEYQSILLVMLMEVAQIRDWEIGTQQQGSSTFNWKILVYPKGFKFWTGYIKIENITRFCT